MHDRPRHAPRPAAFALIALCAVVPAVAPPAAAQPKVAPTDWPKHANTDSSGGFAVAQVATDDAARFMADWNTPTPGVNLHVTNRIARRRPLTTFITYRGCRPDAGGKCNVTATFEIIAPSGKVSPVPRMPVSVDRPAPPPGIIYASQASLGLTFNDPDPLGAYTIRAAITDHVAGVTLHTQQNITLNN